MKKLVSKVLHTDKPHTPSLIVSDLDGTLLNRNSELSAKTIRVVKQLSAAGHLFCIATGRSPRGSICFYKQLGIDTLLINFNGAFIWHPQRPDFMPINIVFSRELVIRLLDSEPVQTYVDNIIVETRRATHLWKAPHTNQEVNEFKSWFNININDENSCRVGASAIRAMEDDPNTILLQIRKHENIDKMVYILKQTFDTFVIRSWSLPNSGDIIEINTKYANKGNSVEFLMSYYGIARDNTYSFGDGDNDVELLLRARSGFAMRNGKNSAKLVSRYVTAFDNEHNGVAVELERCFLRTVTNKKVF